MKGIKWFFTIVLTLASTMAIYAESLIGVEYDGNVSAKVQTQAAQGVFERLIGLESASQFEITIVPKTAEQEDYFSISADDNKIAITASNGISACRALKWYLNNICYSSVTWNGDNVNNLPATLPRDFEAHSETTPYEYRYIFNNCVFGYSTAFWHWKDWERLIDILAYNGINMPAMLMGQEKVWLETYKALGLTEEDLHDFFAGPAWFPWQWMGNLDGWGGPLSVEFMDKQCQLQKQVLIRSRSLGMTPVQTGFSGHIPAALVRKNPDLNYQTMEWAGFPKTYVLNWQDPYFQQISETFIKKQAEIYGTDHYYNVDPFNEMAPPSFEPEYISNMSRTIYESMLKGDPDAVWVMMTWFAKTKNEGWTKERTKIFMDEVPNDRMIALELWGENWGGTGWHWQDGWYGKPWVWSIIQNFGNRVDIYGGLNDIFTNYNRMIDSPARGNLQGMGIMNEGMGFNPIVYELVLDMMWGDGVKNLDTFKSDFLKRRYGQDVPESVVKAWDILFKERYRHNNIIDVSPLSFFPVPNNNANFNIFPMYEAWGYMLEAAEEQKGNKAYQFDLISIGREVVGQLVCNYIYNIETAYKNSDMEALREANAELEVIIRDFDQLLATNEYFLLGKWINDAKNWASSAEEEKLMEWNAKRQITDWGGLIGGYAIKEWSGLSSLTLKQWAYYGKAREDALRDGKMAEDYSTKMREIYDNWTNEATVLNDIPMGDAVKVSTELYNKYTPVIKDYMECDAYRKVTMQNSITGLAVNRDVTATGSAIGYDVANAVDGDTTKNRAWWAPAPASMTIDLGTPMSVGGFWLITFWDNARYYQYTIEVSEDLINWRTVVDESANTTASAEDGFVHSFADGISCRYVRLNMINNSANEAIHVVEFKVLSTADVEKIENFYKGE